VRQRLFRGRSRDLEDKRKVAAGMLTQAFVDSTKGFSTVASLRRVSSSIAPYAQAAILPDATSLAQLFLTESGLRSAFGGNADLVIATLGGMEGITQGFVSQHLSAYEAAIDGASLILAHSVLDSAVYEYCRVTATARPADWESLVEGRKVAMSSLKGSCYEDLLEAKVAEFVKDFERESILKRADRLLAICQPEATSSKGYKYSRERLQQLDDLRHSIVHGRSAYSRLPGIDNDIYFLQATNYFFYNLVMTRYQLPIDSETLLRAAHVEKQEGAKPSSSSGRESSAFQPLSSESVSAEKM